MSNEEILIKAIDKAIFSGSYNFPFFDHESSNDVGKPWSIPVAWLMDRKRYFQIIFDHAFTKAFWGEETITYLPLNWTREKDMNSFNFLDYELKLPAWQYHLKLMVVAEDPIQYLADYV